MYCNVLSMKINYGCSGSFAPRILRKLLSNDGSFLQQNYETVSSFLALKSTWVESERRMENKPEEGSIHIPYLNDFNLNKFTESL